MDDLTARDYTMVIDEIFAYPSNYAGFAIKTDGGTVRYLAYQFDLRPQQIVTILNQMIADGQLVETGIYGSDTLYGPIKE